LFKDIGIIDVLQLLLLLLHETIFLGTKCDFVENQWTGKNVRGG